MNTTPVSRPYAKACRRMALVGLLLGGLVLMPLHPAEAAPADVAFEQSAETVDVYNFVEVALRVAKPGAANPFTDVNVTGQFAREGGAPIKVDGFCDAADGSVYRIRFMPSGAGRHTFTVWFRQGAFERSHSGAFAARDAGRRGPLRLDPERREHFVWEGTGEHYFWNGTTTYFLMGWESDETIREIIDRLADHKINRLRVLVYGRANDQPWRKPIRSTGEFKLYLNPWPAERPGNVRDPGFDLARFNVPFWQKYERMLRHARERDVVVSVVFFIGGMVQPTPFAAYSEDELRYYRYGVARLAAFSNVTWDLGNEHDFHREVPKWADWLGPLVKQWDPHDRLLSAHNKVYRTPGAAWNDMQLIQAWDAGQNGNMVGERARQAATGRVIPQINEEYGYEDLWERAPGMRSAETRRRIAWEISMAGCYQTTGETASRGTGFPPDTGGGWVNGRGDDTMTMLRGYAHMADFLTSFEWWRAVPRNDLARGSAYCLAETGKLYAVYLPRPAIVTLTLEPGNYHARWFHPRTGQWHDAPVAAGPRWTPPPPPGNGDWALLLRRDPNLVDTTPPIPVAALGSLRRSEVWVTFTKPLDPKSIRPENFTLEPGVQVLAAEAAEEPAVVRLSTGAMTGNTTYSLGVRNVQDRASAPNRLAAPVRIAFTVLDAAHPIVELGFNEGEGLTIANTGRASDAHAVGRLTGKQLAWSANAPPTGGRSALDFGAEHAERAVELDGGPVALLRGLKSFTVTGWVNCRSAKGGRGGNRIVTTTKHGGDGFDLVILADGRLQLGVNEWSDRSPARSSPGRITEDAGAAPGNWRFFAVTYDATRTPAEVNFYFGTPDQSATLDATVAYDRGPVGEDIGSLAVGHFNSHTRSDGLADRMFRGLIDEIRVFGSSMDASGALTREEIHTIQEAGGAGQ